jgi:hypothetical protein
LQSAQEWSSLGTWWHEARILAEAMKLSGALFKEPWQAYQVVTDVGDDSDSFSDWELQPLMGVVFR